MFNNDEEEKCGFVPEGYGNYCRIHIDDNVCFWQYRWIPQSFWKWRCLKHLYPKQMSIRNFKIVRPVIHQSLSSIMLSFPFLLAASLVNDSLHPCILLVSLQKQDMNSYKTWRQHGDNDLQQELIPCDHYFKYKSSNVKRSEMLDVAWPSVLWSFLKKGGGDSSALRNNIPLSMKKSWLSFEIFRATNYQIIHQIC